jgi:hypothetical protein
MIIYYRDSILHRYLHPLDVLAAENSDVIKGKD